MNSRLRQSTDQLQNNHSNGVVMHVDLDQQREELFLC